MLKRRRKYETGKSIVSVTIPLEREEWQMLKHRAASLGWRFPKLLRTLIMKGLEDGNS